MFIGETIALGVAVAWTATALFAEVGSKRMGSLPLNTVRMTMSLTLLVLTLWLTMGMPFPRYADGSTWLWLLLSGVVGYVIGDYCLMQGYIYDHRMAMALTVASLGTDSPIIIDDTACVAKSFPAFFDIWNRLS